MKKTMFQIQGKWVIGVEDPNAIAGYRYIAEFDHKPSKEEIDALS